MVFTPTIGFTTDKTGLKVLEPWCELINTTALFITTQGSGA